ncbi:MAG: glycosyltransferase family 87 protein [Pseudomonadota bacterium]
MKVAATLKAYCVVIALVIAIGYPTYLYLADGLIDPAGGEMIGRDFVNYYSASQLWMSGSLPTLFWIFDYRDYLASLYGMEFTLNWSYPPSYLFFVAPIALLPYVLAYVVWMGTGLAIYATTAAKSIAQTALSMKTKLMLLLLAPATVVNVFFGQNGFVTGTLLYLGVRYTSQRPVVAGICFGLLTIKPQLGFLIPIMLLLTRQWKTIFVASGVALSLFVMSGLVFGWQSWVDYFDKAVPFQRHVIEHGGGLFLHMMPTAYAGGRLLDLPIYLCLLMQLPMTLMAFALTVWLFHKPRGDRAATDLLFLICVFMFTPYAFNYDLTALTPAILGYWATRQAPGELTQVQRITVISLFLLPGLVFAAPVGPLILIASAVFLYREIRGSRPSLAHSATRTATA